MTSVRRPRSARSLLSPAVSLLITLSCSPPAEPVASLSNPPAATLLVTNGTCLAGRCDSLEILGFPSKQPNTPGGYWSLDLGRLAGPQACYAIPASATFRIIGVNPDSTRDTVTITWTTLSAMSLGALPPSSSRIQATPSTSAFVPADARAWQITLPGGSTPVPGAPCTP
jgi:hypothetical protein